MKKLLIIFTLLISLSAVSQSKFQIAFLDKLYIGYGVDPVMLKDGPGHDYKNWGITSSYHFHLEMGFEDDWNENNGARFSMTFADHNAIKYRKWAFRADYKLKNNLFWILDVKGLNQYAGLEISNITRRNIQYKVNTPSGTGPLGAFYHTPDSFSLGANIETQYEYPLTHDPDGLRIAIGARYSWFLAESVLTSDGKYIRDEGTIFVYLKF